MALLSACASGPAERNDGPIKITLRKSDWPNQVPFSKMAGSIRLVPLETTPESLLKKVSIEPDDIFFSDTQLALGLTLENEFVASLDPSGLVTRADTILSGKRFRYPAEISRKIHNLKPDDNPVLVFFTFK